MKALTDGQILLQSSENRKFAPSAQADHPKRICATLLSDQPVEVTDTSDIPDIVNHPSALCGPCPRGRGWKGCPACWWG